MLNVREKPNGCTSLSKALPINDDDEQGKVKGEFYFLTIKTIY